MEAKEKIKYFNQCFLTLMNKIPQDSKAIEDSIEFYNSSLLVSMTIFVKRDEKSTLEAAF